MEHRTLVDTPVSVVGLGTWQLGADWGDVSEHAALDVLAAAVEAGVTLFDTADVYGDGRSERLIGRFLAERPDASVLVATKMGRRGPQETGEYRAEHFREWVDRSRSNLGTDTLDLVQLHCPPDGVYANDAAFDALDALVDDGSVTAYGVSVETAAQALAALERPGVRSIQIILNAFRRKPLDEVLPRAAERGVGVLARVPLASGLLSGRYRADTTFAADDHRTFNRDGSAFDVGETFSGVDFETGVAAAQEFAAAAPEDRTPAQAALAWVVQQPGVTSVIPGARSVEQARANAGAALLPPLDEPTLERIEAIYDERLRADVHDRW